MQTQDKYENSLGQITPADLTGWNTVGCFTSFHVCIIYHWNRKTFMHTTIVIYLFFPHNLEHCYMNKLVIENNILIELYFVMYH